MYCEALKSKDVVTQGKYAVIQSDVFDADKSIVLNNAELKRKSAKNSNSDGAHATVNRSCQA